MIDVHRHKDVLHPSYRRLPMQLGEALVADWRTWRLGEQEITCQAAWEVVRQKYADEHAVPPARIVPVVSDNAAGYPLYARIASVEEWAQQVAGYWAPCALPYVYEIGLLADDGSLDNTDIVEFGEDESDVG